MTGSGDQSAVLWDVDTSQKLEVFRGHTSSIRSVAFRQRDDGTSAHVTDWPERDVASAHSAIGRRIPHGRWVPHGGPIDYFR